MPSPAPGAVPSPTPTFSDWPWPRSLALARPAKVVQIDRILFGTIRDYCWELGIREGGMVTCRDNDGEWVEVELPSGDGARLSRAYAWFISVSDAQ